MDQKEFIRLIHKRVANTSIGNSTLRNQGARGVTAVARKFLSELNLTELRNVTKEKFEDWLNTKTLNLKSQFPDGAKENWGAARKALNVFFRRGFLQ